MVLLIFLISLLIIIKSSDIFLDNSIKISKILNIPEVVIGATIVSIGTTLPEILVSTTSSIIGHSDVSYGNAIGSIICNTALIAAISLTYKSVNVNPKELNLGSIFFFLSSIIILISVYFLNYFYRFIGMILIIISFIYFYLSIKNNKTELNVEDINKNSNDNNQNIFIILLYLFISAIFLGISARLMTDSSIEIARMFKIPEANIALSIVALGTSLPELMTCIQSIRKGHNALSLGNIVGANLINLMLVIGISTTIKPYGLPNGVVLFNINSTKIIDIPLYILVTLILLIPIYINKKTSRIQGILLLFIYFLYMCYLYTFV